ncbi:MAG TPA: ABC transporter substrate-binding protein, partial [Candidatus Dormibacteraeota bacterium]|nr:ABC transporter substrate-binding protein [Candidatus Dormibacteraeota bacterium]
TRATYRTQRWLASHGAGDIARAVAPAFPETELPLLERAIGRYLGQGTWARDPLLRREGYDYL